MTSKACCGLEQAQYRTGLLFHDAQQAKRRPPQVAGMGAAHVKDVLAAGEAGQGEPGGDALGEDHEVRLDLLVDHVLVAPPLARPRDARLHLRGVQPTGRSSADDFPRSAELLAH